MRRDTLLVLLELSSAFDTVDYKIVLNLVKSDFGVVGTSGVLDILDK